MTLCVFACAALTLVMHDDAWPRRKWTSGALKEHVCSPACTRLSAGRGSTGNVYSLLSSAVNQSVFALWFLVPSP